MTVDGTRAPPRDGASCARRDRGANASADPRKYFKPLSPPVPRPGPSPAPSSLRAARFRRASPLAHARAPGRGMSAIERVVVPDLARRGPRAPARRTPRRSSPRTNWRPPPRAPASRGPELRRDRDRRDPARGLRAAAARDRGDARGGAAARPPPRASERWSAPRRDAVLPSTRSRCLARPTASSRGARSSARTRARTRKTKTPSSRAHAKAATPSPARPRPISSAEPRASPRRSPSSRGGRPSRAPPRREGSPSRRASSIRSTSCARSPPTASPHVLTLPLLPLLRGEPSSAWSDPRSPPSPRRSRGRSERNGAATRSDSRTRDAERPTRRVSPPPRRRFRFVRAGRGPTPDRTRSRRKRSRR